jgi:hypothetical protein
MASQFFFLGAEEFLNPSMNQRVAEDLADFAESIPHLVLSLHL